MGLCADEEGFGIWPNSLGKGIYGIVLRWIGPFPDRECAHNWLMYSDAGKRIKDGIYLAKGFQQKRFRFLYDFIGRRGPYFPTFVKRLVRSPWAYVGEASSLRHRINKNHETLSKIEDFRAFWLIEIISARFPPNAAYGTTHNASEIAKGLGKYDIDRLVSECALIWRLQPSLNARDKQSLKANHFFIRSIFEIGDRAIDDFDFPTEWGEIAAYQDEAGVRFFRLADSKEWTVA